MKLGAGTSRSMTLSCYIMKERFHYIALPLVEEVQQHIQEMLDGGAICPSQSPWCNAMVLVREKDGSLRFCIKF